MSWPKDCVRGIDISYYQRTMNVPEFVKKNPEIEVYIVRAVWPSGQADQAFPALYDALEDAGKRPGAYLWPNPSKGLSAVGSAWKAALGSRRPSIIGVDCEWSQNDWRLAGVVPKRTITDDTRQTLRMATDMFGENVIAYTSKRFWDENIREHGWEKDYRFWVPNYPTPFQVKPNEWRQCATFEECNQAVIGTTRYAKFPALSEWIPPENVDGWQFSDHGRLLGYSNNLDLNLWKGPIAPLPNYDDLDEPGRSELLRTLSIGHGLVAPLREAEDG